MIEFPKMIYRLRKLPNPDLGGIRLDHRTVTSAEEQHQAARQGWVEHPYAVAQLEKADRRIAWWQHKKEWYEEWKWLLGAVGAFLALIAAIFKLLQV